ncbi:MAG: hypothetical protein ACT4P5_02370, partial [Armatimonadota bacterium]
LHRRGRGHRDWSVEDLATVVAGLLYPPLTAGCYPVSVAGEMASRLRRFAEDHERGDEDDEVEVSVMATAKNPHGDAKRPRKKIAVLEEDPSAQKHRLRSLAYRG